MQNLSDLYSTCCPVCGQRKSRKLPNLSDDFNSIIEAMARELYTAQVQTGTINPELYNATADKLINGMFKGLGGKDFDYDDNRNTLAAYLRQNIYAFSAAKSLAELQHLNSLLIDGEGKTRSFIDFRNAAVDAGYKFNKVWLETEYDNAIASSEMAQKWDELTEDNEYLEYSTVGDDRVRPAHAALDGLTLHRSSPVWKRIWPPLEWNCRCTVIPGSKSKVKYTDAEAGPMGKEAVKNPLFDRNSGIEKTVFSDDHPYIKAAGKRRQFEAEKDYGMQSVERIYDHNTFAAYEPKTSDADYMKWWDAQHKIDGTDDIVVKDVTGSKVLFDSYQTARSGNTTDYFKHHVIRKTGEERWKYAAEFPEILIDPDEVWSQRQNGELVIYYVRYYEDAPYVVVAGDKHGIITALSMYRLDRPKDIRRGALIYRK